MQGRLHDREPDLAASRRRRERARKGDRVDIGADAVEMVLGEPDHIDPELVGQPGFAQRLVDDGAVPLGIAAVRKQEIAEFHGAALLALSASRAALSRLSRYR